MKIRAMATLTAGLLASTFITSPSSFAASKDMTIPASYLIESCKSPLEFECFESVGIVDSNGSFIPGVVVSEKSDLNPTAQNGNTTYNGSSTWAVNQTSVTISAFAQTPSYKGCLSTCSSLRIHVSVPDPLNTKVRFVLRASWLKPMNIQMKALDSDYKYEKIPGGSRWTMEGKGLPFSDFIFNANESATFMDKFSQPIKADTDGTLFEFFLHHAGKSATDSYWEPICADKGFSVQSHNTNMTGDPYWDAVNNALVFSIFAPHFKSTGEMNTGYFKYWTSHEFMDCKYPNNTLTKAPKLTIEILNEDGTKSVATTAISNKNGNLYFVASGFHFSAPKIMIKAEQAVLASATQSEPQTTVVSPSPTPSQIPVKPMIGLSKKLTINCVKGKITKKVTAVSPKCPAGFKKK